MFDERMVYIIHGYDWMIRINHWKTVDYINKYNYMYLYDDQKWKNMVIQPWIKTKMASR